ncbi:hypothetical protein Leryth_017756 [Lithospermum erythrorhizon]|nr:hypothetical protein Leryth_017756 [Lithospermum erythrorhizon]
MSKDNPALAAGVRAGAVIAVFIWAQEEEGHYYPGRVSRWWLKQSLAHLDSSLRNLDPISLVRDHRAKEALTGHGVTIRSFNADLLYEPWEINDDEGQPFATFTEFWDRCLYMPYDPESPLLPPKRIISGDSSRCPSDTLILEDDSEKASNALLSRAWSPGWTSADKALTTFINGPLIEYSKNRRKADSATTSFLSPHLHFGEVSVRKVFHLLRLKQLSWANDTLVDAGMRELWAAGWLHDRIRVVVASFFVKVLQLPWRWGMKYFWDTLLDADLESDALGWQHISGTLPDGRPFDLIDNPQNITPSPILLPAPSR